MTEIKLHSLVRSEAFNPAQNYRIFRAFKLFYRILFDLVGPKIPSLKSGNVYLHTVIDEFNQIPFAFHINDIKGKTIIRCLPHFPGRGVWPKLCKISGN